MLGQRNRAINPLQRVHILERVEILISSAEIIRVMRITMSAAREVTSHKITLHTDAHGPSRLPCGVTVANHKNRRRFLWGGGINLNVGLRESSFWL